MLMVMIHANRLRGGRTTRGLERHSCNWPRRVALAFAAEQTPLGSVSAAGVAARSVRVTHDRATEAPVGPVESRVPGTGTGLKPTPRATRKRSRRPGCWDVDHISGRWRAVRGRWCLMVETHVTI